MSKIYCGIDPGSEGALCIMWPETPETPDHAPTPAHISILSFKDENPYKIADILRNAKESGSLTVAIEDVSSRHNQGVRSSFTFGYNTGLLHGFLIAHSIPYVTVRPQEWQGEIWIRQDKVFKPLKAYPQSDTEDQPEAGPRRRVHPEVDTKKTSINAARRLFPEVNLLRTPKCTTPADGMADALLICEYARRKNL